MLRPYQATVARAIVEAVTGGAGGSISVMISRQGGKNELSAQVELALLVAYSRDGGTLIKAAPTLEPQARVSHARLVERATGAGFATALHTRGLTARLGRAEARFLSAEPNASVVGQTASILLEVDEAQDVEPDKFNKDFRPMAASTNAPVVFYGTPWGANSLLEQAKVTNLAAERRDGRRRHFQFDWTEVARHVPAYAAYVEGERQRLGERHPLFRTQYLLEVVGDADRMLDATALAQLEGEHHRIAAPRVGETYVAGLDVAGVDRFDTETITRDRDWSVLTIARIVPRSGQSPLVHVVEHVAWQGVATETMVDRVTDLARRVWRVRRLAVDASGLGRPIAELLQARMPKNTVDPIVFTRSSKSALGFGLLAATHSGRLQLYTPDGSNEYAETRRQLELARATYPDALTMQFEVDPTEGHDDYLISLALAVHAAGVTHPGERRARGR